MILSRRVPAAAWLSALLVTASGPVFAQDDAAGADPAGRAVVAEAPAAAEVQRREIERREIEFRVVHASGPKEATGPWVDPRLGPVRRRLVRRFDYGRYQLVKSVSQSLAVNEKGAVIVSERHRLEVVPTAFEGGRTRMRVRLVEAHVGAGGPADEEGPATVEMHAETGRRGTLVIGGMPYRDGTILLIIRQPE